MFWERFIQLCQDRGLKMNPAGKEIGLSSGLLSKWKQAYDEGKEPMPTVDKLIAVANYFDCSTDYLLGRVDYKKSAPPAHDLSDDEQELLEYFRSLDRTGRRHVLTFAEDERNALIEKGTAATTA